MMDDSLNILPTSELVKYISPVKLDETGDPANDPSKINLKKLNKIIQSLKDTPVII